MKVFLSWSTELSHKIAKEFRDWLPMVIQSIEPYVSSEDVDKGARWSIDIATELQDSSFGILFITQENLKAPWLNFEAGALSKSIDNGKVSPFLFNIKASDMTGSPLLQFQSTANDKEEIKKLIFSINNTLNSEKIPETKLTLIFEKWWPDLESKLNQLTKELGKTPSESKPKQQDKQQEILEELLELTRTQQKLLRNPETLIPMDYLRSALNKSELIQNIELTNELQNTLSSLRQFILELHDKESIDKGEISLLLRSIYDNIERAYTSHRSTKNPFYLKNIKRTFD